MKAKKVYESLVDESTAEELRDKYPDFNLGKDEDILDDEILSDEYLEERKPIRFLRSEDFDKYKHYEAYEPKDLSRVRDFQKKSKGDFAKEISLAQTMANSITNMNKAIGRAEAAAEVYGGQNEIVDIFYNKAKELGYQGPPPGERLEVLAEKPVLGSKLPKEEQHKTSQQFSRYNRSSPILPLGRVDVRTGECPIFNVYDTWLKYGDTTVEVWRDNKDIHDTSKLDTSNVQQNSLSSILKPKSQEEVDAQKRKYFNYKLIFTSGSTPTSSIGDKKDFVHDQRGSHIGYWEMVDYVNLKHMKELILPYGAKLSGYVYK